MTDYLRSYKSVQSVLEATEEGRCNTYRPSSEDSALDSWAGGASLTEAKSLMAKGWKDLLPEVKRLTAEYEHVFESALINTFDPIADVAGQVVDMGKYLTGEPECMIDFRPVTLTKVGRVVAIHVNNTASSSIDTKMITARGAAICALVDMIERTGNVVEVIAETVITSYGNNNLSYAVTAKASSEALDMGRLLFVLAHPAMLRRIMFAVMERESKPIISEFGIGGGYGRPGDCKQAHKDAILVKRTEHGDPLNSNPAEWIKQNLTNLGLL